MKILKILLAFLFPPISAFMQVGLSMHFIINILLTIMGYLPGGIHAVWLILENKRG